ncbi:class I SAM-dependent methyltransferase [Spongiactinospora rosea]|uniref:Class I SAM-dependent methyltransferase n=1 Tax=Spongiactinospora rosea TaxID=2248750 RepID=A0A366LKK7_9ACTN|nr:class I SAM-dependent methyltransferase [Spongiactinospora rosea]RBQ14347.1 class I SAM-dependent methyltransferase [Spongiactinospora rosea]
MRFDHNDHYHPLLLRSLPRGARTALDVGCGTGRFARRLAARGLEVDALDPSPEVIEDAARVSPAAGVRYQVADITEVALPAARYDYISCLASLHHVPFETVTRLRAALAPGGVLAVLGCYAERTPADYAVGLVAAPVNAVARLAAAVRGPDDGAIRAPVHRPAMSLPEIRRAAARLLPGASVRRLLFWRYLLLYHAGRP